MKTATPGSWCFTARRDGVALECVDMSHQDRLDLVFEYMMR